MSCNIKTEEKNSIMQRYCNRSYYRTWHFYSDYAYYIGVPYIEQKYIVSNTNSVSLCCCFSCCDKNRYSQPKERPPEILPINQEPKKEESDCCDCRKEIDCCGCKCGEGKGCSFCGFCQCGEGKGCNFCGICQCGGGIGCNFCGFCQCGEGIGCNFCGCKCFGDNGCNVCECCICGGGKGCIICGNQCSKGFGYGERIYCPIYGVHDDQEYGQFVYANVCDRFSHEDFFEINFPNEASEIMRVCLIGGLISFIHKEEELDIVFRKLRKE